MDLIALKQQLADFAQARDWDQFHSPKNLAMALNVEAAELLEHFQWLTEQQSAALDDQVLEQVAAELADIQIYLVRLSDKLGVDLAEAVQTKMRSNAEKYPAERVRGSAAKYTSYD